MNPIRSFEGHTPQIDPDAWLDPGCLVIGDVQIGARSSVWPGSIVRGDIHSIRIGSDSAFRFAVVGDPQLYWRLCDANVVLDPDELTREAGRRLRVTLPAGVPGGADV